MRNLMFSGYTSAPPGPPHLKFHLASLALNDLGTQTSIDELNSELWRDPHWNSKDDPVDSDGGLKRWPYLEQYWKAILMQLRHCSVMSLVAFIVLSPSCLLYFALCESGITAPLYLGGYSLLTILPTSGMRGSSEAWNHLKKSCAVKPWG
jgi:hypothetical protein